MKPLSATLRLQFHAGFTLDDACPLVPYFASLGISHVYASPLLTARQGSMHGYDVVDPRRINPELGGEVALQRLVARLREHDMGLILDIVSNHMSVGGASNPWWQDVLEWGPASAYAHFFDIQWQSHDRLLRGQLLLPFLASDYGETLARGQLPLRFCHDRGRFFCEHYEHRFPINPASYGTLLGVTGNPQLIELGEAFAGLPQNAEGHAGADELCAQLLQLTLQAEIMGDIERVLPRFDATTEEGFARLHRLLEEQHYRLASWRTAADDINWRRFFDINDLGGLRVERLDVFEATHAKVFELIEQGLVDGLRIDHVDGLADPRGYCRRLRRRVERLLPQRPAETRLTHFPIYVEKILGEGEALAEDWGVDGTTGYEFMNQVSLVQHDPRGQAPLAALWETCSGRTTDFLAEAREARERVLEGPLAGDFEAVAQLLLSVARSDVMTRDITLGSIRRGLRALIVHFPVYRTYVAASGRRAADEPFFQQALEGARGELDEGQWPLLEHLQRWLGGEPLCQVPLAQRALRRQACRRFQQLTSPAAAKAVEDTACYRSGVLLSRNDVGFDPQHFSASVDAFHAACALRLASFPNNLLATATHDHKRGEDTRARLALLSEHAEPFAALAQQWLQLSQAWVSEQAEGPAPSLGDRLMLLQTLIASWPLEWLDSPADQDYAQRIGRWWEKALREAKLRSSWSAPHEAYESACRGFLEQLLGQDNPAQQLLREQVRALAAAGALNALVQCCLRLCVPGVPDLYQGNEYWDFSLVDPDNRRPVDFATRRTHLAPNSESAELLEQWRDGRIKQWLLARLLRERQASPALFAHGRYLPLRVLGSAAEQIIAFAREYQGQWLLVVLPRLCSHLLADPGRPWIEPQRWGDTRIELPREAAERRWRGLFDDAEVTASGSLPLVDLVQGFPLSVLRENP